jgi:hypothetical protein
MQTPLIGVADIHARPLSDRFEALKFIDLSGVVFLGFGDAGRRFASRLSERDFVLSFEHRNGRGTAARKIGEKMLWDNMFLPPTGWPKLQHLVAAAAATNRMLCLRSPKRRFVR